MSAAYKAMAEMEFSEAERAHLTGLCDAIAWTLGNEQFISETNLAVIRSLLLHGAASRQQATENG